MTATATRTARPAPAAVTLRDKFIDARRALASGMIEREAEIDLLLTAVVAGEHLLLVGPPGVGKSMLFDSLQDWFDGPFFSILLTKHTGPEEVLGQFSLTELRNDRFRRVTAGRLTSAEVGFIDEIWKASSAILNCLLRILNEGVYEQEGRWVKAPLRLCVAASNEWPSSENGGKELGAIFDRFLFRHTVKPVRSAAGRERLLFGDVKVEFTTTITAAEVDAAQAEARAVPFGEDAKDCLREILATLGREGVAPSDRRKRKAVTAARAAAWLDGASEVEPRHLSVLSAVLWDDPAEQPAKVAEVVMRLANPTLHKVSALLGETESVLATVDPTNVGAAAEANKKLRDILKRLAALGNDPAVRDATAFVEAEARTLRAKALAASDF